MADTAPKGLTKEQIAEALSKSGGIKLAAAKLLGITRQTVSWWVEKYPELAEHVAEVEERLLDMAQIPVVSAINRGDLKACYWWLERKGKHLGFSPRVESTGPDGGPIAVTSRIRVTYDYVQPQPLPELEPERPA